MNNQSTALEGGAMPSAHKFNPLTTDAIAKSIKAMEYDMAKERVEPYITRGTSSDVAISYTHFVCGYIKVYP